MKLHELGCAEKSASASGNSLRRRSGWAWDKSSVGTKLWLLPTQLRTRNSTESYRCANDTSGCEPPDLRRQPGRPAEREGEAVAGVGFVRTRNRRLFVECPSRIPPAHHAAGLVSAPSPGGCGF